jgi:hypothetical protein
MPTPHPAGRSLVLPNPRIRRDRTRETRSWRRISVVRGPARSGSTDQFVGSVARRVRSRLTLPTIVLIDEVDRWITRWRGLSWWWGIAPRSARRTAPRPSGSASRWITRRRGLRRCRAIAPRPSRGTARWITRRRGLSWWWGIAPRSARRTAPRSSGSPARGLPGTSPGRDREHDEADDQDVVDRMDRVVHAARVMKDHSGEDDHHEETETQHAQRRIPASHSHAEHGYDATAAGAKSGVDA